MATFGPLLTRTLERISSSPESEARLAIASLGGNEETGALPIVAGLPRVRPELGEGWAHYKERAAEAMGPFLARARDLMDPGIVPLYAGNAARASMTVPQVRYLGEDDALQYVELDPLVQVTAMDDVSRDIDSPVFSSNNPGITGVGVSVGVLDSGIDMHHPALRVLHSVETCGESVSIPGAHGTHCAGIIASNDALYRGVASGVDLYNIKVLRSNGSGRETYIAQGIDAALDRRVRVLSMSLGFNHLPTWSNGGHGWSCPQARCVLCSAVDTAVVADGALIVVAAGNEHDRAEALRMWGQGNSFDTELGCPGQAEHALTVGAVTKSTYFPAGFSSWGPTADGRAKPDLCAPGVNVMSTIPVPRDSLGQPVANPARHLLFGRMSGTSMATPIVAGAAALVIAKHVAAGTPWTSASVRAQLLTQGTLPTAFPAKVAGIGRLSLRRL